MKGFPTKQTKLGIPYRPIIYHSSCDICMYVPIYTYYIHTYIHVYIHRHCTQADVHGHICMHVYMLYDCLHLGMYIADK